MELGKKIALPVKLRKIEWQYAIRKWIHTYKHICEYIIAQDKRIQLKFSSLFKRVLYCIQYIIMQVEYQAILLNLIYTSVQLKLFLMFSHSFFLSFSFSPPPPPNLCSVSFSHSSSLYRRRLQYCSFISLLFMYRGIHDVTRNSVLVINCLLCACWKGVDSILVQH